MAKQDIDREQIETTIQKCYSTWGTSYYKDYYGQDAPYPPVHIDLLRRQIIDSGARSVLDAGCGPASFLRHLTRDGLDLYGFDLTTEMVDEAKRIFLELGLEPERVWQGSVLDRDAYRAPRKAAGDAGYDAAVCVGVLPHIAGSNDATVFANVRESLRPGGLALIEGRNQLFSLFTQNRPSYEFIRDELIGADAVLAAAGEAREPLSAALEQLKAQFRMDLPPIRRGKSGEPGYDEVLSRTHNPLVLSRQFEAAGFCDVRVLFYHFHAIPPMLASGVPEFFLKASVAMEDPEDWRGYFMASAFVLAGSRA